MTREEVKEMLPIMQAYAEGKTIQFRENINNMWEDIIRPSFNKSPSAYRIKPEPRYRPFKTQEECWNEMQKHQPFGWVRENSSGHYKHINNLYTNKISFQETEIAESGNFEWSFAVLFKSYTFADGTPFGLKEE